MPGAFHHMNDISFYLKRMIMSHYLVVSAPSAGVLNVCKVKKVLFMVQNRKLVRKMCFFDGEPLPPSVYLGRHWHHSRDNTVVSWKSAHPWKSGYPLLLARLNFRYRVKVYSNEHPPWSKLRMVDGVYLWSLRSTATSAMHIWGKKLRVMLHRRLLQGSVA